MQRLRPLWLIAPLFSGACSFINAPADIDAGTGGGGTGGTGGTTTTSTGGTGGTTTETPAECGDGKIEGAEACDDDNTSPGDGCSATCTVEDGWECVPAGEGSSCTKLCGNGKVDIGEECDDEGATDPAMPPGNQDYCSADCKLQEFDVESGADTSIVHEMPVVGYRRDSGAEPSFYVLWHAANANKILGREYFFDGTYKKANFFDVANSPSPDGSGELFCTAPTGRSLVVWRDDGGQGTVYSRKVDSDGSFTDKTAINFAMPLPHLSCAAQPTSETFVVTTMVKGAGVFWDILVQPFESSAIAQGEPFDAGDALGPSATASWGVGNGFLVAWVLDPTNKPDIVAQRLKDDGTKDEGFLFTLVDSALDSGPAEPAGAGLGIQNRFALAYTRTSLPDAMDVTHREVVVRTFQEPGTPGLTLPVSTGVTDQREPVIGVNPTNGNFVVVWTAEATGGENVYRRVFNSMGVPLGEELIVNEVQPGEQTRPSVAVSPMTGDVVVVWDHFVPNSNKPHKISAKILPALLQ